MALPRSLFDFVRDSYERLAQSLESLQSYFQSHVDEVLQANEILETIANMVNEHPPAVYWEEVQHGLIGVAETTNELNEVKYAPAHLLSLSEDIASLREEMRSHAKRHADTIDALKKDNKSQAATIKAQAATIEALKKDNESHAAAIKNLEILVSIPLQKRQIVSKAATLVRATLLHHVSWSASEDVSRLQDLGEYMRWAVPFIIRDGGFYGQVPKAGAPPSRTTEIHEVVKELPQSAQINIAEKYLAFVKLLQEQTSKTPGDFFSAMDALRLAGN
ncbi:uncharacterized protein MONBRDRAFT_25033 [Monosiga brevicollis MX1]|uniref:Uncharacterized protein n=1 Tax=Monosiga brevicollis TaxID=81824 RepID=A9UXK5_MONBE|nr:uncharacterized protein MONBRDRAFT_25033 [Monosiga brevicollis MX1]EDQ89856.1 predicted protein [Monosiga brevicollis MX1]|eukprot:XP_001745278.1 hypothetical protein [Monosiga brevicollis MX1]